MSAPRAGSLRDEPDPDLLALASEVRRGKGDWVRIDDIWERFRNKHSLHLRRDTNLDADRFLVEMFSDARGVGLLRILAFELLRDDLVPDDFMEQVENVTGRPMGVLHAFQNREFLPKDAKLAARALSAAITQVCRIDIGNIQRGTGVLIRPRLVATAAHVIWELVDLHPDGTLRAAEGSKSKLTLTFGDAVDYLSDDSDQTERGPGEVADLYPDWLAWVSPPADYERPGAPLDISRFDGISPDDGPWDLALIRLAKDRDTPRMAKLLDEDARSDAFQIHILHHPHRCNGIAEPLVWSIGLLDRQLGDPPVRWLHNANTQQGSSGAPVFDSGWRIIALHQAGERTRHSAGETGAPAEGGHNRAVPVRRWCKRVAAIESLGYHDGSFVTELKNAPDLDPRPYPVIGRRETQQRVWRAMQPDATAAQRLLIIRGEPGTGLRFTERLVREMVTEGRHAVVTLEVTNALDNTAAGFAERIIGALAEELPLADDGTPPQDAVPRTISSELAPALCARLEDLVGDRAAWLVLQGFDKPGIEIPSEVKDLIVDLIGRLQEYPKLRLVLTGWLETPPGSEDSVETLLPPTVEDIAGCLTPLWEAPDEKVIRMVKAHLELEGRTDYPAAHEVLVLLGPTVRRYVSQAGGA